MTHHAILIRVSWKLLKSRLHVSNRWLQLRENDYELPDGKRLPSYWLVEKPSYVIVVGECREGLLLVREYRAGIDGMCLSFPAGFIDDGETAEEAAVREFREETGRTATNPRVLGRLQPQGAWLQSTCNVVYVDAGEPVAGSRIDSEIDEVLTVSWEGVRERIHSGEITEMHAVASYYLARDLLSRS